MALILISAFSLTEFIMSFSSHSLALLADAGHMLSDSLALGVSLLASWIAQLPASNRATFGYRRIEILAALLNGTGLIGIAIWVAWEAIARLYAPPVEILSLPMLITAGIGLVINSLNASLLHRHSHDDLNLRGAFLHMVADAMSSVGVILAAIAVWTLHWNWADGAVSLVVAGLVLLGAVPLVRQSLNILLEKTPSHLDVEQIQSHLAGFEGVVSVDALHVWTIALGQEALSAQIKVNLQEGWRRDRLLNQLQTALQQEFGISEVFLQLSSPVSASVMSLSQPETLELLRLSASEFNKLER
jgi:cobalt-zinc-cadmium efflux system protein